ncbi:MAG: hypothetical protein IPL59_20070 [Candidatus Competibacteraceae bacterium]|nr:hypothetical protein [Candidatus Competibacteraceae bacterium]MBK8754347.1 hypothetical protein [Candidatus Competibacteraceae bacterium]
MHPRKAIQNEVIRSAPGGGADNAGFGADGQVWNDRDGTIHQDRTLPSLNEGEDRRGRGAD